MYDATSKDQKSEKDTTGVSRVEFSTFAYVECQSLLLRRFALPAREIPTLKETLKFKFHAPASETTQHYETKRA
jgi:hypothetical protein